MARGRGAAAGAAGAGVGNGGRGIGRGGMRGGGGGYMGEQTHHSNKNSYSNSNDNMQQDVRYHASIKSNVNNVSVTSSNDSPSVCCKSFAKIAKNKQ